MFRQAKLFYLKAITPMHPGSGQDLGIVDQPIQRERHTNFPKIEGSSLKGSIREIFRENSNGKTTKDKMISLAFGPDSGDVNAGALGFTDARLLFFPVKSMKGVFAWITCPGVLKSLEEDLGICKNTGALEVDFGVVDQIKNLDNGLYISNDNCKNQLSDKDVIVLEEYAFKKCEDTEFDFAQLNKIIPDSVDIDQVIIISDDDFKDFVSLSTEVITRTNIDPDTGTVKSGALFNEEYLPAESVLYSLVLASSVFKEDVVNLPLRNESDIMAFFEKNIPGIIQLGGNATLGKGIAEITKWEHIESKGD